ncbi:hypothetical protein LSH36_8g14036 [Paralvinella palmiformis]|uniref:XPA C-terminal domain-containing protein n=1 Tax=Paralvinella palmiformis TaxID=53620 RepID=A0AAD9NJP6_9ANNE|nr:hypothetical protein LSH36_8g14036 [Paralvinella palmiformis]
MAKSKLDKEATHLNAADESAKNDGAVKLSDSQRARIERNRQKALMLKQSRLTSRPYSLDHSQRSRQTKVPKQPVDTGGGFLLEEDDTEPSPVNIVHPAPPLLGVDALLCEECNKEFMESYLYEKFDLPICDKCRDPEEKHALISKSNAKDIYLLKDCDLDRREPPLKFIVKKNPRNDKWGDMKLYLECQVSERALEVWGSEEKLEEQREVRVANKNKMKQKRYNKKVKELRLAVRSSLWKPNTGVHEHEFGPETYNEDKDEYIKMCLSCGHTISYEKM